MPYIDAEYMFKCESCRHFRENKCNTFCDSGESYSPDVSKIPTADVAEVKHGEWKWDERFSDYTCSLCHDWDLKTPNYCSNCGTKMDKERKEK